MGKVTYCPVTTCSSTCRSNIRTISIQNLDSTRSTKCIKSTRPVLSTCDNCCNQGGCEYFRFRNFVFFFLRVSRNTKLFTTHHSPSSVITHPSLLTPHPSPYSTSLTPHHSPLITPFITRNSNLHSRRHFSYFNTSQKVLVRCRVVAQQNV